MSSILVLGAGFVAEPLVDYLARKHYQITLASHQLHEAQAIAAHHSSVTPIELNVSDTAALAHAVKQHSMVVSFVPFVFHELVAEVCIAEKRHLVTASYETEKMRGLHKSALENEVLIVNEIGLDPGIDHLSAMKIFHEIHAEGEALDAFVSWCGGIPAPSANTNPLGYKFSWSPKSVLLALLNDAKYINEGQERVIPADNLLSEISHLSLANDLKLEGYANRDSTSYVSSYDIHEAKRVLRGTLRYPGFADIMQSSKQVGLFDQDEQVIEQWRNKSWLDYIQSNLAMPLGDYLSAQKPAVKEAFEFLGMLDGEHSITDDASILDAFCGLLTRKLAYEEDEADMVVMQHQFSSTCAEKGQMYRTSTLVLEGDPNGYSAMAKTVGTPAAITVDMILTGQIQRKGVVLPLYEDFYQPILRQLAQEGIELEETIYTKSPN